MNQVKSAQKAAELVGAASCRQTLNVEKAVGDLDVAIGSLFDALNPLAETLSPILGGAYPCETAKDREHGESEVADRVFANAYQVRMAAEHIRDLTRRL